MNNAIKVALLDMIGKEATVQTALGGPLDPTTRDSRVRPGSSKEPIVANEIDLTNFSHTRDGLTPFYTGSCVVHCLHSDEQAAGDLLDVVDNLLNGRNLITQPPNTVGRIEQISLESAPDVKFLEEPQLFDARGVVTVLYVLFTQD